MDAVLALPALDQLVLGILLLATLRGLWIGVIREAFSLAALAAAALAVRLGTAAMAGWLMENVPFPLTPGAARIAGGTVLAVAAVLLVGGIGSGLRRGARAVGLGLLDRLAGGALGVAEGALAAGLLVLLASSLLGPGHPAVADTLAQAALDRARGTTPAHVAAPPPSRDP
jgi:membrane protein required for colicin V production